MSFLYNMATAVLTLLVVAMIAFVAVGFKTAGLPNQSANFPGHDYEGRVSDGLKASPGIREIPQQVPRSTK
jgi:hypothetical protein